MSLDSPQTLNFALTILDENKESCKKPYPHYINAIAVVDKNGSRVTYTCISGSSPCAYSDTCHKIVREHPGRKMVLECHNQEWVRVKPWLGKPEEPPVLPTHFYCPRCETGASKHTYYFYSYTTQHRQGMYLNCKFLACSFGIKVRAIPFKK